jgi:hypothetical protein
LAVAGLRLPNPALRVGSLAALGLAWAAANQRGLDPILQFDPAQAESHTHHLSSAARLIGDAQIALGPKPARKWAGLGPLGAAAGLALASQNQPLLAALAGFVGAAGNILGLMPLRRPERALRVTLRETLPSLGAGLALGALLLLVYKRPSD